VEQEFVDFVGKGVGGAVGVFAERGDVEGILGYRYPLQRRNTVK